MRHPPYHLRINKAVDRFLLVEAIGLLAHTPQKIRSYTYHGMGGPFLEDFRLLGNGFPDLKQRSIESNEQTYLRQMFHKPSKRIKLVRSDMNSYLANFDGDGKHIFWLDYTDMKPSRFEELKIVLDKVGAGSLVKITLCADAPDNPFHKTGSEERKKDEFLAAFRSKFEKYLPPTINEADFRPITFIELLQKMVRAAVSQALPAGGGREFQLINSCHYDDNTAMFSLMGVVCEEGLVADTRKLFSKWRERNFDWSSPKKVSVPELTLKERLLLDRHLPTKQNKAAILAKVLGYRIEDSENASLERLKQYSAYYRYYPLFAKVSV